jgi:hypothetical protein
MKMPMVVAGSEQPGFSSKNNALKKSFFYHEDREVFSF